MIFHRAEQYWTHRCKHGVWQACIILDDAFKVENKTIGRYICRLNKHTLRTICKSDPELSDYLIEESIDNFFGVTLQIQNDIPYGKAVMGPIGRDLMVIDEVC